MKNKIKIYRAKFELTQAQLAELVQVSRQSINAIEKSKYVPSTVLALKLARVFKVRVEDLFELENLD
ncbi:helix-turn-helix transcriptional regulator [uncultured Mesonia sp.]|uniref:helix-turn-helix transcriptional regulator n=1 Tax=uncultured Mesonia sp. TaxID=399731 RepID=UPI00374F57F1